MGERNDAMVYSGMKNNLTSQSWLSHFQRILDNNVNYNDPRLRDGFNLTEAGTTDMKTLLDVILDKATLKRACCSGKNAVPVRMPSIPENTTDALDDKKKFADIYGFYDHNIEVNPKLCELLVPGYKGTLDTGDTSGKCDNFYQVYCQNMVNEYRESLGNDPFGYTYFSTMYKPECACYMPLPGWIKPPEDGGVVKPLPAECLHPGCESGNGTAYLDPISRKYNAPCAGAICVAQFDADKLNAGGNIGIKNKVEQNCGTGFGGNTDNGNNKQPTNTTPPDNNQPDDTTPTDNNQPDDTTPPDANKPDDTPDPDNNTGPEQPPAFNPETPETGPSEPPAFNPNTTPVVPPGAATGTSTTSGINLAFALGIPSFLCCCCIFIIILILALR